MSLRLFSQAHWLLNASERLMALASESTSLSLSSLVGPGRQARGMRITWDQTCSAVHDVTPLLDAWKQAPTHVRWCEPAFPELRLGWERVLESCFG